MLIYFPFHFQTNICRYTIKTAAGTPSCSNFRHRLSLRYVSSFTRCLSECLRHLRQLNSITVNSLVVAQKYSIHRIQKMIFAMLWIPYKTAQPTTRDYFRSRYILILLRRVFSNRHECNNFDNEWYLKYDTCNSILDLFEVIAIVSISDFFDVFMQQKQCKNT